MFEFVSAVRGCYIYKDIWEPSVGEKLIAPREFGNQFNKFAVKVLNTREQRGIFSLMEDQLPLLYYYMRNFCNLIGLEQWYFNLI